jgi:hypothetical protein
MLSMAFEMRCALLYVGRMTEKHISIVFFLTGSRGFWLSENR